LAQTGPTLDAVVTGMGGTGVLTITALMAIAAHIVQTALVALYRAANISEPQLQAQLAPLGIDANKGDPAAR